MNEHILIVEDEEKLARFVELELLHEGYQVSKSSNGREALAMAVAGDFAICIYNPSSHKRRDYLKRACDILLDAGAETSRACGYVVNIGREGMESRVLTLEELKGQEVNMFTTVFIGNSESFIWGDKLITKRGYKI